MTSNLNGFDITLPAIILEKMRQDDALRYLSKYYTVTNGSAAFDTLQALIPHTTVYYICIHKINHVCDFITLNYTSMTQYVGNY